MNGSYVWMQMFINLAYECQIPKWDRLHRTQLNPRKQAQGKIMMASQRNEALLSLSGEHLIDRVPQQSGGSSATLIKEEVAHTCGPSNNYHT